MNVTERKRLSFIWMSDLSNCGNQSQQWTAKHLHQTPGVSFGFGTLSSLFCTSLTLRNSLLLLLLLAGLFCGSVWIYDGELK